MTAGTEPDRSEEPEWGRLSRPDARVLGCASISRDGGIVPATQATPSLAHVEPAAPAGDRVAPQSHSLMPLLSENHLRRALRQCGRRSSSPGADGMTWRDLRQRAGAVLPDLATQLAEGTWHP